LHVTKNGGRAQKPESLRSLKGGSGKRRGKERAMSPHYLEEVYAYAFIDFTLFRKRYKLRSIVPIEDE